MPRTPEDYKLYIAYHGMKQRCLNKKNKAYHRYGGRGIKICEEWLKDPSTFYKWCKNHTITKELSLDRIDNDGNYEPGNCRWSSKKVQANNQSRTIMVEHNGKMRPLREIIVNPTVSPDRVRHRLLKGLDIDTAICIGRYARLNPTKSRPPASKDTRKKLRDIKYKKIEKLDDYGKVIGTYKSLQSAAKRNNIATPTISNHLSGRTKSAGGHQWRYAS